LLVPPTSGRLGHFPCISAARRGSAPFSLTHCFRFGHLCFCFCFCWVPCFHSAAILIPSALEYRTRATSVTVGTYHKEAHRCIYQRYYDNECVQDPPRLHYDDSAIRACENTISSAWRRILSDGNGFSADDRRSSDLASLASDERHGESARPFNLTCPRRGVKNHLQ
jgi:hypothetical protein